LFGLPAEKNMKKLYRTPRSHFVMVLLCVVACSWPREWLGVRFTHGQTLTPPSSVQITPVKGAAGGSESLLEVTVSPPLISASGSDPSIFYKVSFVSRTVAVDAIALATTARPIPGLTSNLFTLDGIVRETKIKTGSRCSASGCQDIVSMRECDKAGKKLSLGSAESDDQLGDSFDPPFCYFKADQVKFNVGLNTGPCTAQDSCICMCPYDNSIRDLKNGRFIKGFNAVALMSRFEILEATLFVSSEQNLPANFIVRDDKNSGYFFLGGRLNDHDVFVYVALSWCDSNQICAQVVDARKTIADNR
jgi:hypothetical protein